MAGFKWILVAEDQVNPGMLLMMEKLKWLVLQIQGVEVRYVPFPAQFLRVLEPVCLIPILATIDQTKEEAVITGVKWKEGKDLFLLIMNSITAWSFSQN